MSIEIYTSDNLSIIASKGEYYTPTIEEDTGKVEKGKKDRFTIRLHITILVNGKLKNIFQQYNIKNVEENVKLDNPYQLENYMGFQTLIEVLRDLGYEIQGWYQLIDKAIEKLFND